MIRRYMLDTNQVSDIVRNLSVKARNRLADLKPNEFACVSAITEGELLYGLVKKPEATALHQALRKFFGLIEVLPWRHEEAVAYSHLRAKQEKLGRRVEPMDMLIAAHAIATDSILVSRDKAFRQIADLPGLTNWSTDLQ